MPASELGEKQQKQPLHREIRDMMSILTNRLTHLQKKPTDQGGSASNVVHHDHDYEGEQNGIGMITMAGSNEGATMTGDMSMEDQKSGMKEHNEHEVSPLTTYLNSNFQGVNNSIMVGGGYSSNDPGIHLDVEDYYEQHLAQPKHGKKAKKAHFGSSKSDHSSS
ncbi:hypothetical protein R6Q57_019553 [Mikania cordata]